MQLSQQFAYLYDNLANESDEKLTLDAIELRDAMIQDIAEIKEVGLG